MAFDKITMTQGDTAPQVRLTFTEEDTGNPLNLTGGTVKLFFRAVGADTNTFVHNCYINPATATTGVAIINWSAGELDVEPGDYTGQIEVTRASGQIETITDKMKFKILEQYG